MLISRIRANHSCLFTFHSATRRTCADNTTGDFSFGESFQCLETQSSHPWVNTIFDNLKVITFIGLSKRFSLLQRTLPYFIPSSAREQTKKHLAYLDEKITQRIELGTSRPDFISPMLKHNKDGKGLTPGEIRANMGLMIVAGSESVVTVACGAIYHMLKNPHTMERLVREVRGAYHSESEITSQSVPKLKYLAGVIKESLRLYPSTPTLPACRVPPEGSLVCGKWVPGNVCHRLSCVRRTINLALNACPIAIAAHSLLHAVFLLHTRSSRFACILVIHSSLPGLTQTLCHLDRCLNKSIRSIPQPFEF